MIVSCRYWTGAEGESGIVRSGLLSDRRQGQSWVLAIDMERWGYLCL